MKVVIIGGVAGGASAAARLRRLNESAKIIILERGEYVSFANCGLPYYIGGVITDSDDLTLQTPESFWKRFRIDVRVRHEVTDIDTAAKTVTVHGLDTGKTYTESYDKLILSPGARPSAPDMPGLDSDRVFTLRTVEDTLKIRSFIDEKKPSSAVVIGGGFIGIEMAENLSAQGAKVTLVEYADHILAPFDADMAAQLHILMKKHGIKLMLGTAVTGFEEKDSKLTVKTSAGDVTADMALLAIGVTPDTSLDRKSVV